MSRRKKILLVNVFFAPQSVGGATRVIEDNLADMLEHHGDRYDFTVVCANAEPQAGKPYEMTAYPWCGVRVYRINVPAVERMDWKPTDPEVQPLFGEVLDLEKPDLVHFHCIQRLGGGVVEATIARGIPYVVTVHDAWWISDYQFLVDEQGRTYPQGHPDIYQDVPTPEGISTTESRVRKAYLKNLLRSARSVVAVSERFRQVYASNGFGDAVAIPNGVSSAQRWAPKQTGHTRNVVCAHIGGMAKHKGFPLFRDALRAHAGGGIEGLVVDLSKEQGYERATRWGAVRVRQVGRYAHDRVVELYQRIDVLFAPSLWPESFGLVTREAAACGCWVVASSIGAIGEDVHEGVDGFVLADVSVAGIGEVLSRLAADPARFKAMPPARRLRSSADQARELIGLYDAQLQATSATA